mmetsp:Transcript_23523/g.60128  ORF Transcript_23523/g.60128 Transcript_23523/m.60128 type:complete len:383 (-) Transcript_23523:373-1521(-)
MDVWAKQYFGRATFICVGCDGPGLATAFANELRLTKCLLTYVDQANGPRWGQLGCNGFIIIDANGKVANRQTSAYLEVKELAFAHVESLLESMLTNSPPPSLGLGEHVELYGLSRFDLNGMRGYLIEATSASGRCAVQTYDGKKLAVRPENVRAVAEEEGDSESFDRTTGGCMQPASGAADVDDDMPERMKRAKAKRELSSAPIEQTKRVAALATTSTEDVAPLATIHSVHVAELDQEHEQCAAALAGLIEAPTREAILRVVDAYTAHFAHEEALLDEHLYTAAATAAASEGSFSKEASMRKSHYADHQRMIGDLKARAVSLPAGGPTCGPKAWIHTPNGESPAVFVNRVLRAFEQHANVYDAAYAEPLAAQLGEVAAVPVQ